MNQWFIFYPQRNRLSALHTRSLFSGRGIQCVALTLFKQTQFNHEEEKREDVRTGCENTSSLTERQHSLSCEVLSSFTVVGCLLM